MTKKALVWPSFLLLWWRLASEPHPQGVCTGVEDLGKKSLSNGRGSWVAGTSRGSWVWVWMWVWVKFVGVGND